jgi:acylphosphatase
MSGDSNGAVKTLLVRMFGTVQGVGYRAACVRRALALQVTGWVRNRMDGSVEALLQGDPERVSRMCDWLVNGSHAALVEKMEAEELAPPFARYEDFRQIADL